MFAYYNNGLSFRAVDDDYDPQAGEIIFDDYAKEADLEKAFSSYKILKNTLKIKIEIARLEASISPRMVQEALAGITTPHPDYDNKPADECIRNIRGKIADLRSQIK